MTDLLTRIEQNQPIKAQELYDYIVEAIVKQGRPSVGDNDRCLYRGPDGLKCAAGHVIPDSMYSPVRMEDKSVDTLRRDSKLPDSLIPHVELLFRLQNAHDGNSQRVDFLSCFLSGAKHTAVVFNLKSHEQPT
jgi:hypothetical protein